MPEPTPGQVAYETYYLEMENMRPAGLGRWASLEAQVRAAWEAAAQAVRATARYAAAPDTPPDRPGPSR